MKLWLSSSWEPNWRSFQYFNLYRLIVAGLVAAGLLSSTAWQVVFLHAAPQWVLAIGGLYSVVVGCGLGLSLTWQRRFNLQLSSQVAVDILAVNAAMYAAGGVSSGFGIVFLVTLAAASLVGRGRLVLLYAALATIALLLMQGYGVLTEGFDAASFVQAGFLSAGFFATAILARLLGQRVMANEELARRRGIELENQRRISQQVIARVLDGVLVVGGDGRVLRSNPVAAAMLGEDFGKQRPLAFYSRTLAEAVDVWRRGGGSPEAVIAAAGGGTLQARFEPTESSDREVLVFLEDIGRIQEKAEQLKLASLGRLTASIAHEIRNPLAAISHAGELLREERRGEMQDRLLKILNDNVGRLDRIVQDILDLGRRDRAQLEALSLATVLAEFVAEFAEATGLAPALVSVHAEDGAVLCFDRSHLRQVLWNLVANAVRHSRGLPGSVGLHAHAGADPRQVELHVIDDGPGVPAEIRGQVFEPFFTTRASGTGLGLFIARELCEANGASLELGPEVDCGHFIVSGRYDTCQQEGPNAGFAAN